MTDGCATGQAAGGGLHGLDNAAAMAEAAVTGLSILVTALNTIANIMGRYGL